MKQNNRTQEQIDFEDLYRHLSQWMTKNPSLVQDVNRYTGWMSGNKSSTIQKMKAWAERVSKGSTHWSNNLEPGTEMPRSFGGKRKSKSKTLKKRRQSKKKQTRRK